MQNFSNSTSALIGLASSKNIAVSDAGIGVLAVVVSLLTIMGNSLLLGIIFRRPYLHTQAMLLLCSLTVADLMVGIVVMPMACADLLWEDWKFGLVVCDLWHAFDVFASTVSIWSLCLISWDRYSAVKHPVHYNNTATIGRGFRRLSAMWLISGCISFPGIAWWRYANPDVYLDETQCVFSNSTAFIILSSMVSFYIPFTVLLYSYWRVFETASRHENAIRTGQKRLTKRANRGNDARFRSLYIRVHRGRGKATQSAPGSKCSARARVELQLNAESNKLLGKTLVARTTSSCSAGRARARNRSSSHLGLLSDNFHLINEVAVDVPLVEEEPHGETEDEEQDYCCEDDSDINSPSPNSSSSSSADKVYINNNVNSDHFLERIEVSQIIQTMPTSQDDGQKEDNKITKISSEETSPIPDNNTLQTPIGANSVRFDRFSASFNHPRQQRNLPEKKETVKKMNSAPAVLHPNENRSSIPKRTPSTLHKSPTSPALMKTMTVNRERRKSRSYFFNTKPRILQEKRAARMLGIVIGGFAICWLPFFVINITAVLCSGCVSKRLFQAATWLGYLNSTFNPLIYTSFNRELHAAVSEALCCRRRRISQFRRSIRAVVHNSLSVVPALATRQPPPSVSIHDGPFHHLRPEVINEDANE